MDDLPSELLASAFEMGVLDWGVRFLPPICMVCRTWNDIVSNTPHLWGIVDVSPHSSPRLLQDQIARAKHAPLTLFIARGSHKKKALEPVLQKLVGLSQNWISAVLPSDVLERCRWHDLRRTLRVLTINQGCPEKDSPFFTVENGVDSVDLRQPPSLTKFSVMGPNPPTQLLSRSLTTLSLSPGRTRPYELNKTLDQLSMVPKVETLSVSSLKHHPRLPSTPRIVRLANLTSLSLSNIDYPSLLLCSLACLSLEVLSLGPSPQYPRWFNQQPDPAMRSLTPFLSQWCDPGYTPVRLQTLRFEQCLTNGDVPYLIRFLARLPSVVHLTIHDDVVARYLEQGDAEVSDNVFKALASPCQGSASGWICPRLGYIDVEGDVPFHTLLNLAKARGVHSPTSDAPRSLRKVTGYLCRDGTEEEMDLLKSLVQDVECACLACGAGLLTLT